MSDITVNQNPINRLSLIGIFILKNGNIMICDNKATKYPTKILIELSINECILVCI